MKLVAVIETVTSVTPGKYLVEMTGDELARLTNRSQERREHVPRCNAPEEARFAVGCEYPIDDFWKRLKAAEKVQDQLGDAADLLAQLSLTLTSLKVPDLDAVAKAGPETSEIDLSTMGRPVNIEQV